MPSTQTVATDLQEVPYQDLPSGRIWCQKDKADPDHGGGYSDVYVGYLTEDNQARTKVAVKVLRLISDPDSVSRVKTHLIRETTVWILLNHENVLEFLGLTQEHGRYGCPALVSPYCNNGTVLTYLKSHSDPDIRFSMLRGAAKGLEYLHQNDVIHGDLKPSNILVHDDGRPLLCDFGRSRILDTRGFTTRPAGVARYQAPEVHQGLPLTKASDVYAFGITSYEIWTGITPWESRQDAPVILDIVLNDARPTLPNNVPPGTERLWGIFEQCWAKEPGKRPGMGKVVQNLTLS